MSQDPQQRRLVAIMFTDMVGYTALGQKNESLSLNMVDAQRKLIRPILKDHLGREVKTIGDAFLVEFGSALEAVKCAYDIQISIREFNASLPEEKRIHLRIGLHSGDVVGYPEEGNDIAGDAVNVTSRIQQLAEDGGVCLTRQVADNVLNKIGLQLASLGERVLKNVGSPIEIYKIVMPWDTAVDALAHSTSQVIESDVKRIAVLPYANMSPDPNDEYFADGMTEELIDRLAQVKKLKVISRTSAMSYKRKNKTAREIAKELLVGLLVEGSVRKSGNRIRVTAQLIEAGSEEHIWSSHFDGNLDDIFAVQSEIAERVAGELNVQLLQSEKRTIEKKPTDSIEAYSNFLRARELFREGSELSTRNALKLFERALALDPGFARAHVGVAECHQRLTTVGYEPPDIMLHVVKASLKRAIELDPGLAEAHASLATMHYNEDDLSGTEVEAKKALTFNPSLPEAYGMLSEIAGNKGEPDEMVRNAEAAYRLDPVMPHYIRLLGGTYFMTGREKEALEHWKKTESLAPADTYRDMTDYYLSKGEITKAREFHARFAKLQPTHPWVTYTDGIIAASTGDREKALLAIKQIEERKIGPVGFNFVAYIYNALGDMDSYFDNLNKALDAHAQIAVYFTCSPLLSRSRKDPRYKSLVEKLKLQTGLGK